MDLNRLYAAAAVLVRRVQARCRMGSVFTAAEADWVRAKLGDTYPAWLLRLQTTVPLCGLEIGYVSRTHSAETQWLRWSDAESAVKEAIDLVPGKAILPSGFIPVGMCLAGSEDPYFVQDSKDAPLFQISHDEGLNAGSILANGCRQVTESLADFFESAVLYRSGDQREFVRQLPQPSQPSEPASVETCGADLEAERADDQSEPVPEDEQEAASEQQTGRAFVFGSCRNPACNIPLTPGLLSTRFGHCGDLGEAAGQLCAACLDVYACEPGLLERLEIWASVRGQLMGLFQEAGVAVLLALHGSAEHGLAIEVAGNGCFLSLLSAGLVETIPLEVPATRIRLSARGRRMLECWFAAG